LLRITSVNSPSPASRAGFRRYDVLISCNGEPLRDWLDFFSAASGLFAEVEFSRGNRISSRLMRRLGGTDWGFTFQGQEPRRCNKKCIFCFVDQMPASVRPELRIKDDDVRYSFFQGTYVTLRKGDVEYAIEKGLSPLHVSVHATDPAVRGNLLGTLRNEPILPSLRKLSDAGTIIETQIVVVPGINDGDVLAASLEELIDIEGVVSVGVVPVGLTRYRDGLHNLERTTGIGASQTIDICDSFRTLSMERRNRALVFPSDEFFAISGREIPRPEYYENFSLLENGIGMLSRLLYGNSRKFLGNGLICTGALAAPFLERVLGDSDYGILPVNNCFLGDTITVAGLLSGRDVVRSVIENDSPYTRLVLPAVMFNHRMLTLDDLRPEDIEEQTGMELVVAHGVEGLD
jgi:putative radical SAM enzyme (TIGR03279 family)